MSPQLWIRVRFLYPRYTNTILGIEMPEIKYTSIQDLLKSIIKDVFVKDVKHYSITDTGVITGYSREYGNILKTMVSVYDVPISDAEKVCSEIKTDGVCYRITIKLMYQDNQNYEETTVEIPAKIANVYIGIYDEKNKKKAWAIAFTEQRKIEKEHPELIALPAWKQGRKWKHSGTVIIIMNKQQFKELSEKVEQWIKSVRKVESPYEVGGEMEETATQETPSVNPEEILETQELELEGVEETTAVAKTTIEAPKKAELVKIYFLSMRLPSKYIVQEVKLTKNGAGFQEIRDFSDKIRAGIASRLEGIRREAYTGIERIFAHVEELGVWIAVTDQAVEEAKKLTEWIQTELKKIAKLYELRPDVMNELSKRYGVKAIPVYLEPEDAKEILKKAIEACSKDVEELKQRIEEASKEKKKSYLKKLEQKLEYKKALLESLKAYLAQISA